MNTTFSMVMNITTLGDPCATDENFRASVIVADILIGISYFIIPGLMFYFGRKEKLRANCTMWLFMAFIICCGMTHIFGTIPRGLLRTYFVGSTKWLTAVVSVACAVNMIWEIPRLAQAERNINELQKQLIELSSYVFHEVRVPLNSIKLGVKILLTRRVPRICKSTLGIIDKSVSRISTTLNSILDYTKIRNGRFTANKTPVNIGEFYDEICHSFQVVDAEKPLDFQTHFDPDLNGKIVIMDEHKMFQCVSNILSNAFKYTKQGGIVFSVLLGDGPDGPLIFQVRDTGIGIAPDQIKEIFNPYVRIEDGKSSDIGTGLGLYIANIIAGLHEGTIDVRSSFGKGSTFTIKIKCIFDDSVRIDIESRRISTPEDRIIHILIVDDNRDNRNMMSKYLDILKNKGFHIQTDTATNGREAVDFIERRPDVDLIIMDKNMPVMDGMEATKLLRRRGFKNKIVALTGLGFHNEIEKLHAAGFDQVFTKPIEFDKFETFLRSLI
jgi:two-component system, sensor histidine kinase